MREYENQKSGVSCYTSKKSVLTKRKLSTLKCWEKYQGDQTLNTELAMRGAISDLHKSIFSRMVGMNAS